MSCFPVPVKSVVLNEHNAALLKNEREEWEAPGGRRSGEVPRVVRGGKPYGWYKSSAIARSQHLALLDGSDP